MSFFDQIEDFEGPERYRDWDNEDDESIFDEPLSAREEFLNENEEFQQRIDDQYGEEE